jgi:pathogenesis-related protein 1
MLKKTIIFTSLMIGMTMAMSATVLTEGEQTEMVAAHNTWRAEVGAPKLKWSDKLGDSAQAWAETLKKDKACKMVHSHVAGIGENLFWASPLTYSSGKVEVQAVSPTKATGSWGSEKKDYTYATNTCAAGKVCGHYTQVVWKKSTEVGCGKAICADKSQVWACQYTPAGNYVGQKPY